MQVRVEPFDTYEGKQVHKIVLSNEKGICVSVLDYGATWYSFDVCDGKTSKNLILNFAHAKDYADTGLCVGQTVGPVAGRIANGSYQIDDVDYELPRNIEAHSLHSGGAGFSTKFWDFTTEADDESASVTFSLNTNDTPCGTPGSLLAQVVYSLDEAGELTIRFEGTCIGDTAVLFNPCNHAYFNLEDAPVLTDSVLHIAADARLELDSDLIPTGTFTSVKNTPYDFKKPANLALAIEQTAGGFDDMFVVDPDSKQPQVELVDPKSGRGVKIFSDRNCVVIYTLNGVAPGVSFVRGQGAQAQSHAGVAIELQTLPDAIHHEGFGDTVLYPHQKASYTTRYQYFNCK